MKIVKNKTQKPLRVPLPRGKTLHLGPGKSGQIATEAAEHAALKKLVASGEIEVVEAGDEPDAAGGGGPRSGGAAQGHGSGGMIRRSGDR